VDSVKARPIDPFLSGVYMLLFKARIERCQKNYHRDNWLVAAKSSYRRRFLILRCRLFLSLLCSRSKGNDCSPLKRERELGLDRRETGWFYPTEEVDKVFYNNDFIHECVERRSVKYERNYRSTPLVSASIGPNAERSYACELMAEGLLSQKLI